jgi:hypothetical protein
LDRVPERAGINARERSNTMTQYKRKIGRSAISGRFVPVRYADQHKRTTIVQTIKTKSSKKK